MRRFELSEGTSNKFWQVDVAGANVTVTFGKIGTNGQTQVKTFDDETKAAAEADKLVREKTKKGYVEVGAVTPVAAPPVAAAPAKKTAPKPVAAPAPAPAPVPAPAAPPTPVAVAPRAAWQFARIDGTVVLEGPFGLAYSFRDGVANVRDEATEKWGILGRQGGLVTELRYDALWPSYQNRLGFKVGDKWGWLDPTGRVAIRALFDEIHNFNRQPPLTSFRLDRKWGVVHADGSIVVPATMDQVSIGPDGWMLAEKAGRFAYLDVSGKQVLDWSPRKSSVFYCDRAWAMVDGKCGFIDRSGALVIPAVYEEVWAFEENLALVKKDGKHGWIDVDGRTVIPFDFAGGVGFDGGRAFAWLPGAGARCIDASGKWVSDETFGHATAFQSGTAVVGKSKGGPFGLVDPEGRVVLPMEYAKMGAVFPAAYERAPGERGGHRWIGRQTDDGTRFGFVDERGAVVCDPGFVDLQPSEGDLVAVRVMTSLRHAVLAPPSTPVQEPSPATETYAPGVRLTQEYLRDQIRLRARPALADEMIAVVRASLDQHRGGELRAQLRKLLRSEEAQAQLRACAYFVLEALGAEAVPVLEVTVEVVRTLRSHGEADYTVQALDAIDTWESACARARLFGDFPSPTRNAPRALRALAIVGSGTGTRRDVARRAFARIEAEHPGAVRALLADPELPGTEAEGVHALATMHGIGAPEASGQELPVAARPAPHKKLPEHWDARLLARPALMGRVKVLPLAALDTIAVGLESGKLDAAELKRTCDATSLRDFAWSVFAKWDDDRSPPKQKWALTMLGDFGDDETVSKLAPLIGEWPGQAAHARAVMGLGVLRAIGSDAALRAIYRLSQRAKFGGLKGEAGTAITGIARSRGLTEQELADRLVPDLDLDDDGSTSLDYGARTFRVGFDESLRPFMRDAAGKKLDDLPKPGQSDDAAKAADAGTRWKALKKEVRAIASLQIERLERAMQDRRQWHADAFRLYFVEHPLLQHLARRLVWGTYDGASLVTTFRVAEDGTLASIEDRAMTLADGAMLGIVHPLELPKGALERWGSLFAEYELLQPFDQLTRDLHAITDEERQTRVIKRYAGLQVKGGAVMGLLTRGWSRGRPQDNGIVEELDGSMGLLGLTMPLEPGIYVGAAAQEDQKLGAIRVHGTGPLAEVDAIAFSEAIRTLERLRASQ